MKATLHYDVLVDLVFISEEFRLLDIAIRASGEYAYHAELGQFWYGACNHQRFWDESEDEDPCIHTFTRRQVDTVLIKSIEMLAHYDNPSREAYYKLYEELMNVLREAINRCAELNGLKQRV